MTAIEDKGFILWIAPDCTSEECEDLREQILACRESKRTFVTNHSVEWIFVPHGAVLSVPDANSEDVERVQQEVRAATEDPDYVGIINFVVRNSTPPWLPLD